MGPPYSRAKVLFLTVCCFSLYCFLDFAEQENVAETLMVGAPRAVENKYWSSTIKTMNSSNFEHLESCIVSWKGN